MDQHEKTAYDFGSHHDYHDYGGWVLGAEGGIYGKSGF